MTPLEKILEKLPDARQNSSGYSARCPAHKDKSPSLSITEGDDGRALLHCHAGCETEAVVAELELTMADLMPPLDQNGPERQRSRPTSTSRTTWPDVQTAAKALCRKGQCGGAWKYDAADGSPTMAVVRIDLGDQKEFRQLHPEAGGWACGAPAGPKPLYRLPELGKSKADVVYVVEGEKCVDALASTGATVTTSPGGSKAADRSDWTPLAGRSVVILPDYDEPGRKYAAAVAKILQELKPPAQVSVLELPGLEEGEDIDDWIAQRRSRGLDDPDILEELAKLETDSCERKPVSRALTPAEVVANWCEQGPLKHEPTGIAKLDEMTDGGPRYGDVVFLVGAPDAGKTLLLTQIADTYRERGVLVGLLAVDEDADGIVTRLLQRRAWKRKQCEVRQRSDLEGMAKDMANVNVLIFGPDTTIEQAAAELAARAANLNIGAMLGIDSLQTVRCSSEEGADSTYSSVSARAYAIKRVASEHRLIVASTVEMNRGAYRSRDARERVSDLAAGKDSGAIEYVARILISLRSVAGESDLVELKVSKNKLGPIHRDDETGVYLRLVRSRQILDEDEAFTPPQEDHITARDRGQRSLEDAAKVSLEIARNPGLSERDLIPKASVAVGGMGKARLREVLERLGDALVKLDGPRRSKLHYLNGNQVPDEIANLIPLTDRATVEAATPPVLVTESECAPVRPDAVGCTSRLSSARLPVGGRDSDAVHSRETQSEPQASDAVADAVDDTTEDAQLQEEP